MLNRLASLATSTSVLKALPGKLDIKRHSPSILYILPQGRFATTIKELSGRVLDLRLRGYGFEPHLHCVLIEQDTFILA